MRSVRTAKRLRVLAWLVTLYALAVAVGGVVGGVLLSRYVREVPFEITDEGRYVPAFTEQPYVWQGVAVAVGSVVVGSLLLLVSELVRLRAQLVVEAAASSAPSRDAARREPSTYRAAAGPPVVPAVVPRRAEVRRSRRVKGGDRVFVLSAAESEALAGSLPPNFNEGWYPDPLGQADLRRWNGQQWTGEQRTIALPQL